MTVHTFDSDQARARWQEILSLTDEQGSAVVIERDGKPAAAVIPYGDYLAVQAELDAARSARENEGRVTLTDHPHIVRIEDHYGGRPIIRGTGVAVQNVVEQLRLGQTPEQLVDLYAGTLSLAQLYDALSYYSEHSEEIEGDIADDLEWLRRGPRLEVRS